MGLEHSLWGRGNADKMQMIYQLEEGPPQSSNATEALIDSLVFSQSKTVRTSTMILGAFNILVALLTASSILYDCYWASRRANGGHKAKCVWVLWMDPMVLTSDQEILRVRNTSRRNISTRACFRDLCPRFNFPRGTGDWTLEFVYIRLFRHRSVCISGYAIAFYLMVSFLANQLKQSSWFLTFRSSLVSSVPFAPSGRGASQLEESMMCQYALR